MLQKLEYIKVVYQKENKNHDKRKIYINFKEEIKTEEENKETDDSSKNYENCIASCSNIDTTSYVKSDTTSYNDINKKSTSINKILTPSYQNCIDGINKNVKQNNTENTKIKNKNLHLLSQTLNFENLTKKTETDYQKVIACFYTLFEKTSGYKPTWHDRIGADTKRLLKQLSSEELCRRLKNYFACDDAFIKKNLSWGGFIANIDIPLVVGEKNKKIDYDKMIKEAEDKGLLGLADGLKQEKSNKEKAMLLC